MRIQYFIKGILILGIFLSTEYVRAQVEEKFYTSALTKDQTVYQWPAEGATPTSGWLETTWTQGTPFNDLCPRDTAGNIRYATGCAATALAQIINYHKYLGDLKFGKADQYLTDSKCIRFDEDSCIYDFPGFGTLNSLLDQIRFKYKASLPLTSNETAALCLSSGVVNCLDYTENGSQIKNNPSMVNAFVNRLDYFNAVYLSSKDTNFISTLTNNIINGIPAIIFLSDHVVVVDGYNTNGFYHLNFGWCSGCPDDISNTWYKPENLPGNYNEFHSGILNIQPVDFVYHPKISSTMDQIKFSCARPGEKSEWEIFTLKNTGTDPVHIDDILVSHNFEVNIGDDNALLLQPGKEFQLQVRCAPDRIGQINGRIQVLSSWEGVNHYLSVQLTGYGVSCEGTTIKTDYVSGIWQKMKSPYFICNDIRVPAGKKLEIQPGVKIIVMGSHQITVDAKAQLVAKGSLTDSIYFTTIDGQNGWHGLYFINSINDDTLDYCVISNVNAPWGKTALYIKKSSPTVIHTSITGNKSCFYSGGVRLYGSSASISYSRISGNICTATYGAGALDIRKSSVSLNNILICHNEAESGGALQINQSSVSLKNVTITDNKTQKLGGAMILTCGSHLKLKNSIIWQNEAESGSTLTFKESVGKDTIEFSYSNIDTSASDWLFISDNSKNDAFIFWDHGNISEDPWFHNPEGHDYTLLEGSSCIDGGDPTDGFSLEPMPNGGRINMGVFGGTNNATISGGPTIIDINNPNTYYLSQNYPNPFNPVTMIKFQLPMTNWIELSIYNLLGQKVATLVNAKLQSGSYNVKWDAVKYAAGVYYYQLKAGEYLEVKKMVLIR